MHDALEGRFRITNLAWNDLLLDKTSKMYQDLSTRLEIGLMEQLVPLQLGNQADFFLGNFNFESGSVKVKYRIGWIPYSIDNQTILARKQALANLMSSLQNSNGLLFDLYEVDSDSVSMNCE